jgi:hypothetical protein
MIWSITIYYIFIFVFRVWMPIHLLYFSRANSDNDKVHEGHLHTKKKRRAHGLISRCLDWGCVAPGQWTHPPTSWSMVGCRPLLFLGPPCLHDRVIPLLCICCRKLDQSPATKAWVGQDRWGWQWCICAVYWVAVVSIFDTFNEAACTRPVGQPQVDTRC